MVLPCILIEPLFWLPGWFSWTKVHPIEEQMLPSFFNGKSETRTPDAYLEIRNCIMKIFHANPGVFIELKDLLELEVGDFDARQEVMEFLDHWGLINFDPSPPTGSAVASAEGDGLAEKDSLVDKLYHFEALQSRSSVVPKTNITSPTVPSGLFPESAIAEELVRPEGPAVEYHCNSCSADCSRKRYHCQKQVCSFIGVIDFILNFVAVLANGRIHFSDLHFDLTLAFFNS